MLWMTILIGGANPPENITLLGTHDFDTGGQIGVSAPPRGSSLPTSAEFQREGNRLTIG